MTKKHRNLLVDLSNVANTVRHGKLKHPKTRRQKERFAKEYIFKETLKNIMYTASHLRVDAIVVCCESRNVWRKDIFPEYKQNHSDDEDLYKEDKFAAMDELADFFRDYTSVKVLKAFRSEADDIIGVWCQESEGVENIIMSTDKDFIQLISYNTKLYNFHHKSREFRESENPELDLFVKVVRGDKNDNIRSAYPRVQKKRLERAYDSDYEMLQLLEERLPDGTKVGDKIDFNMKLIDLYAQPDEIREAIRREIRNTKTAKYSNIKVMQYFTNNNLEAFFDMLEQFGRVLKKEPIWRA